MVPVAGSRDTATKGIAVSILHYDPYTWRLAELDTLHQHPTRERGAAQTRRDELAAELVIAEAEELTHGRRHLTIEHAPTNGARGDDVLDRDRLDHLADVIDVLTATLPARRITRTDRHLTVTVTGRDATLAIAAIAEQVARLNPGHWHLTPSARPTRHQIAH